MKIVWNTCDKKLDGEIKSAIENYFKISHENFQKSLQFSEIYVKHSEKNSI